MGFRKFWQFPKSEISKKIKKNVGRKNIFRKLFFFEFCFFVKYASVAFQRAIGHLLTLIFKIWFTARKNVKFREKRHFFQKKKHQNRVWQTTSGYSGCPKCIVFDAYGTEREKRQTDFQKKFPKKIIQLFFEKKNHFRFFWKCSKKRVRKKVFEKKWFSLFLCFLESTRSQLHFAPKNVAKLQKLAKLHQFPC